MGLVAFGAYLRHLREAHGYSQPQVAAATGASLKAIYQWERGRQEPGVQMAAKLMAFLEGDPADQQRLLLEAPDLGEAGRSSAAARLERIEAARIAALVALDRQGEVDLMAIIERHQRAIEELQRRLGDEP